MKQDDHLRPDPVPVPRLRSATSSAVGTPRALAAVEPVDTAPLVDGGGNAGTVTLGDFFGVLRRHLLIVALGLLLGILAALALLSIATPVYDAQSAIKVAPVVVTGDTGAAKDISTITESRIVTSTAVAQLAAKRLGYVGGATTLLKHVSTSSPLNSQLIYVNFSAGSASRAADGANAFAASYLDYRRSAAENKLLKQADALTRQVAGLRGQVARLSPKGDGPATKTALRNQIATLNTALYSAQTTVVVPGDIVGTAAVPSDPSSPRKVLYLVGGVLFGLLLGVLAAIIRDRRDDRVHGVTDFQTATGAPVLATIPSLTSARGKTDAKSLAADQVRQDGYRTVATKLRTSYRSSGRNAFLVLRSGPRTADGAVAHLAEALTAQGLRVAVVAARPGAQLAGSGDARTGDTNFVAQGSDAVQVTDTGSLRIVDLGEEDSLGAVINRSGQNIGQATSWADVVLVDGVNVERPSSALALGQLAPAAVVTGTQRRTTHAQAVTLHRDLTQIGIESVGAVLFQPTGRGRRSATRTGKG